MDPKNLSVNDFTYDLPPERIAAFPLEERDQSRLLIYQHQRITEDVYQNLAGHLPENALLVFNDTKVIEARMLFQKTTGGVIELFVLEPADKYNDIGIALSQLGKAVWKCLIGGA